MTGPRYRCRAGTGEWEDSAEHGPTLAAEAYAASVRDEYGPDERAEGIVVEVMSTWTGTVYRVRVREVVTVHYAVEIVR